MFGEFDRHKALIEEQYRQVNWNGDSGCSPEQLERAVFSLKEELEKQGLPRPLVKARLFALILDRAQIAVVPEEFFQDHIRHDFLLQKVRRQWIDEVMSGPLAEKWQTREKLRTSGVLTANYDFGHTVPDWYDILYFGIPGLLERVNGARKRKQDAGTLTEEQAVFYDSCEIVYEAFLRYIRRLADECLSAAARNAENEARLRFCAASLEHLCVAAPGNLHEGLQLVYLFHILQEEIEGERLRSLGGLDRVYRGLYEKDLADGTFTREQEGELFRDFFQKFHALTGDTLFGEPMYLGGTLANGSCAVNDLTWLILESYDALSIANPKFHIRISDNTPLRFISQVCDCIRRGNSSFVFVSDECAVPMMMKVGATLEEAREFVPIGCYEPGILGREVACTGNGGFNLPKALELALHNGTDPMTGEKTGIETGNPETFDTFDKLCHAVKAQMMYLADVTADLIVSFEGHYMEMNPSPLFSATMTECVEKGTDAYAGGAKYNHSSLYMYSNATLADSLAAIDRLVYLDREMSLRELTEILDRNWENRESLRLRMLRSHEKWGNDRGLPDDICVSLCDPVARYINGKKNGRGGRFKAAMYTIDHNYFYGEHTGATPDGRKAGELLSRNLGAVSGMDRSGITALMRSCTKLDLSEYPTGTVVDIMLHPTAVAGEEGLKAFTALITTFMKMGGYAIHGNVFDAEVLRAAQRDPDKYRNLQVRVCGWNVYFVNLSKQEQDEFIKRAELAG